MTSLSQTDVESLYSWLWQPYGRFFNNLTFPDSPEAHLELSEITGGSLMATAAAAGAKVAIFDGRNQWFALHNSNVCRKHPGLGERDLVQEMIDAGRKHGIIYVPYIPIDCDQTAWHEHPEWRRVDINGEPMGSGILPVLCHNSPFRQFFADYLKDFAANYDIGGFWFDGVGTAESCYCQSCRIGFQTRYNRKAPVSAAADPEGWKLWLEYKKEEIEQTITTYCAAGKSVKPGLPVCTPWVGVAKSSDQLWFETGYSWSTAFLQLIRSESGKPVEFYTPSHQHAHRIALSLQELRDRAMASIANGAINDFTLTGRPVDLRTVTSELEERAAYVSGSEPEPYAAVVYSQKSRDLCEPDTWKDGPTFTLYGALKSLLEEKIPQTCIADCNLEHDDLSKHKVIFIPDAGVISAHVAEKLKTFVAAGGGLVAGFRTSLHNDNGTQRSDFLLADLFGVHYRGVMERSTAITPWVTETGSGQPRANTAAGSLLKLGNHSIANDPLIRDSWMVEVVPEYRRGYPADCNLSYPGKMLKVEADSDSELILWDEFQEPGKKWPLMTARSYGKGRVVYCAGDLAFQYAGHWTGPYVRRLICNAVRWCTGDNPPPFKVESLLQVQATLFRQAANNRLVLHLLNAPSPYGYPPFTSQTWEGYFTSFSRIREDIAPVIETGVKLHGKFRRVYTVPGNHILAAEFKDGYTEVVVPRFDTHIMVVAEAD